MNEPGLALAEHERPVGKLPDGPLVTRPETLLVQALVESGGTRLAGDLQETVVVVAAALGARPVTGGERGRFVEEEELRVAPRLLLLDAPAILELEPAGDPALDLESTHDRPVRIVQAASVAVDEPTRRVGDQLAERGDAVLQRHRR